LADVISGLLSNFTVQSGQRVKNCTQP